MARRVIVDSGPLVAFLDRREAHHAWISEQAKTLPLPWLLCEAVLAESWHLLRSLPRAQDAMLEMVKSGLLKVEFALTGEIGQLRLLRVGFRRCEQPRAPGAAERATRYISPRPLMGTLKNLSAYPIRDVYSQPGTLYAVPCD